MTNNLFDFLRMGGTTNTPPVRHRMRSVLLVLGLLLGSMNVWGAEVEFTPSSCTNWGTSQAAQSQEIDGITFSSTSGMKSGTEHLRLYSGATHTFSSTVGNITSIVFTCTASGTNNYGPGKMSGDGYSYSGTVGTWSGNASTVTITGGQSRCTSIVVTYTPSSGTPTCGTPTISPAEGTFYGSQEITITTSTSDASIYYTTDNSTPSSSNGTLYVDPFSITETTTIKAIAIKAGADDSEVATATYTKGASVTSFNIDFETNTLAAYVNWTFDNIGIHSTQITPHGGEYYGANLNAGGNGVGTASITTSAIFANPGILTFVTSKESTNNNASSWIVQVSEDGTSWTDVETFDATTGGKGTWTEREADLSAYADVYVRIAYSGNTAIRTIDDISLAEASALPKAVKPTFTGDETFLNSTSVSLSTTTEGASIYYTMGDAPADPTASSTLYEGPINVAATTTIKAIAVKTGMDNSPVAEKTFTKATIMTVADAKAAITAAGSTPIENQYVEGVISQIDSYDGTHHSITYWISDDGTTTDQLEVYSGKGLNGADFAGLSALSLGDAVIVKGTLKNYKGTDEFDMNSQIIQLNRTIAAPTFTPDGAGFLTTLSVALASATDGAEVRYTVDGSDPVSTSTLYENPIELSATTTIKAAAFKGSDVSAIITRTFTKGMKITVAEALAALDLNSPIENQFVYGKVSTASTGIYSGKLTYYISDDGSTNDQLEVYNGLGLNGVAFADKTDLQVGDEVTVYGTLKIYNTTKEFDGGNYLLEFNRKADAGLAWDPADDITLTVGDAFTAPTLLNPNSIDAAEITIASSNTDVATVTAGVVELVADATGEATITATFAGNDDYKPATVSYTITVNAAAVVLTDYYEKVTSTAGIVEGTYLIVYEDAEVAFNGALGYDNDHKIDIENNTIDVEITADHKIGVTTETEAATFYIDPTAGSIQAASGKYIGVGSYSNGLAVSDDASAYNNALSIDADGNAVIVISTSGGDMTLRYNSASNQARFRYYKSGQQAIALYKLANEVIKPEAGLAWDPADDIELTVGETFTAPTLLNPNSIDAAEITIESSNTDLATVTAGAVELVADATGTATITATFAGNASYKPATVSYKIKVNPASSIYVAPSLNVNFGSVEKNAAAPADQTITVTLNNVAAATATLGGTNPEAFSVDKTALTASGDITISVAGTATVGEFKATLTISDDASAAASKEVKLSFTVTDPASEETAISTTSKWVAATAGDLVDGAEVLIIGVNSGDYYAMGEQTNNNRTAVQGSVDGDVFTPGANTMSFTLVAQEGEKFALRASNGKYLYAASSGSNYLRSQAELDDNGKWTLTISSAVANGTNTRNTMQFNSGSSIFACYGSASQKPIAFYVPAPAPKYSVTYAANGGTGDAPAAVEYEEGETFAVAAADLFTAPAGKEFDKWNDGTNDYAPGATYTVGTADVVLTAQWKDAAPAPTYTEVRTGLTIGKYYTICYPKAMTDIKGATLWSFIGKDETTAYIVQESAPFAAGKPYIMCATAEKFEAIFEGDDASASSNNGLYGTLDYMDATALANAGATHMLYNNEVSPIGTDNHLDANRAYIILANISGGKPAGMPAHMVRSVPMHKDVITGMDELNASEAPVKVLINGQLFILRGEKMYNANGQLVK